MFNAAMLAPLLFILVGGLAYMFAKHPKVEQLGFVTFGCGMLALAFALAQHIVKF